MTPPRRSELRVASRPLAPEVPPRASADAVATEVDLLRADLYRMLDEIARAGGERHRVLVRAFEEAWRSYKVATRRS